MKQLNSKGGQGAGFKIKMLGPNEFQIGDTSHFSPYTRGGFVTAVKQGFTLDFVC